MRQTVFMDTEGETKIKGRKDKYKKGQAVEETERSNKMEINKKGIAAKESPVESTELKFHMIEALFSKRSTGRSTSTKY